MIDPFKLLELVIYDVFHPEIKHPWGVIAMSGEAGSGKTISMAEYAKIQSPKIYKNVDLKIFTNFDLEGQTGQIKSVDDIVNAPRDSILLIDETTNWFDAHKWSSLPPEMLQPLTQHRHMDIQLVFAAQLFKHMDPRIRDLCNVVVECSTWAGRLTTQHWYRKNDYELIAGTEDEFRHGKARKKYSFVQTPELRAMYDTKHEVIRQLIQKQNESYKLNCQSA